MNVLLRERRIGDEMEGALVFVDSPVCTPKGATRSCFRSSGILILRYSSGLVIQ